MRCEDAAWKMLLYVDGELSPDDAADVEAHLAQCPDCRAELERVRRTQATVDDGLHVEGLDRSSLRRIRSGVEHGREVRRRTRPARMARAIGLGALLSVLLALGTIALQAYLVPLTSQPIALELTCPSRAADDGPFAFTVRVRDAVTGSPLAGQPIHASFALNEAVGPTSSVGGRTDAQGVYHGVLHAPPLAHPRPGAVVLRAGRGFAGGEVEYPLRVEPARALHVWSDRALATPGSTIGLGCVVLRRGSAGPVAEERVTFELIDPRGRTISRTESLSDAWGIATREVRLPTPARAGCYRVTARGGGEVASCAISVVPEAAPELGVDLTVVKPATGGPPTVRIAVTTRAGAPVAGCPVRLAELPRAGDARTFAALVTGPDGKCEVDQPTRAVDGGSTLRLLAEATTARLATGSGLLEVSLDGDRLDVVVAPRGGYIVPSRQTILDVLVLAAGRPAAAHISGRVGSSQYELETGPDGVAELWMEAIAEGAQIPASLRATTDDGRAGSTRLQLHSAPAGTLVAAPDRGVCRVGEALSVDLSSDQDGLAEVALLREGTCVWRGSAPVAGGEGRLTIPLRSEHIGSLAVAARWLETGGDEPGPALAPLVFVLPLEGVRVEWSTTRAESVDAPLGASLRTRGGDRIEGVLLPLDSRPPGVLPQLARHPSLAFARLAARDGEALGPAGLTALGRSLVSREKPSRSRRPSRVLLEAAAATVTPQAVSPAGPAELRAGVRRRQCSVFRAVAVAASALLAGTLVVLFVAGEAHQRSLHSLGEAETARVALRGLRTDLLVAGVCLVVSTTTAARMHVALAQAPEVTRLSGVALPAQEPQPDLRELLDRLAPEAAYLPLAPSLAPRPALRSDMDEELAQSLSVALPWVEGESTIDVLALSRDGGLGFSDLSLRRRSSVDCELSVDPVSFAGAATWGALRLCNHTAFAQRAKTTVTLPRGATWLDAPRPEVVLAPHSVSQVPFRFACDGLGVATVTAAATTSEGLNWEGRVRVTVRGATTPGLLTAGVVSRDAPCTIAQPSGAAGPISEVRLVAGRRAVAEQLIDAYSPPWLATEAPASVAWLYPRVVGLLRGVDARSVAARGVARDRTRSAREALLASMEADGGFAPVVGEPEGVEATAWALLGLSRLAEQDPELDPVRDAARARLASLLEQPSSATRRAVGAWALAEAGAEWQQVSALLPVLADAPRPTDDDLMRWALAALAADACRGEGERDAYADALATAWRESRIGQTPATVLALCALAFRASPDGALERPSDAELLGAIAARRQADGLFGSGLADALCGAALLEVMSPRHQPATVSCALGDAEPVRVVVPPDGWASVLFEQAETAAGALSVATLRQEPVQYAVLTAGPARDGDQWVLSVRGEAGATVGSAWLEVGPRLPGPGFRSARIAMPAGLEPYLPDLAKATAGISSARLEWAGGLLHVVTDQPLAVGFRVRAVRRPTIEATRLSGVLRSAAGL